MTKHYFKKINVLKNVREKEIYGVGLTPYIITN